MGRDLRKILEQDIDARFTHRELVESDIDPQEKGQAEVARVRSIRESYAEPDAGKHSPAMLRSDRVREDVQFMMAVYDGLQNIIRNLVAERNQAQHAAQQLHARLKRIEAGQDKVLVAPSGQDLKTVLASRR